MTIFTTPPEIDDITKNLTAIQRQLLWKQKIEDKGEAFLITSEELEARRERKKEENIFVPD
jgi:hypothetical protein